MMEHKLLQAYEWHSSKHKVFYARSQIHHVLLFKKFSLKPAKLGVLSCYPADVSPGSSVGPARSHLQEYLQAEASETALLEAPENYFFMTRRIDIVSGMFQIYSPTEPEPSSASFFGSIACSVCYVDCITRWKMWMDLWSAFDCSRPWSSFFRKDLKMERSGWPLLTR